MTEQFCQFIDNVLLAKTPANVYSQYEDTAKPPLLDKAMLPRISGVEKFLGNKADVVLRNHCTKNRGMRAQLLTLVSK